MAKFNVQTGDGFVPLLPTAPQPTIVASSSYIDDVQGLPGTLFWSNMNGSWGGSNLIVWPFYVSSPINITDYIFRVITNNNATTTEFRVGIYQKNPDFSSDGLVVEFTSTTIPATTTGVFKTSVGTPYRLPVGEYYIAWVFENTLVLRTIRAATPVALQDSTGNSNLARIRNTGVSATSPMPSSLTKLTVTPDASTWGPAVLLYWTNE